MAPWPHPQGGGAGRGDRLGRAISARPAEAGPVMEMAVVRDPRHEAGPIAEPILIFHPLILAKPVTQARSAQIQPQRARRARRGRGSSNRCGHSLA